jgi:hypothetical protein
MRRSSPLATTLVCGVLAACGGDSSTPPSIQADGSLALLQSEVFAKSCAVSGCHIGSSVASSGNLSLAGDAAYDNLVGVIPTQLTARQDGLRRVVPFKPESSLLYHKLVSPPLSAHDYGNAMPVGTDPLFAGQVEFFRQWIAAGAPRTGKVADAALLTDKTPQVTAPFLPLPAPAQGTGYQVHVDTFTVKPQFERELFVYRQLHNPSEIYVKRVEFRMRPRSHHFVMYTFDPATSTQVIPQPDVVRDIRRADGSLDFFAMLPMAYHIFFGGSMQTEFAYDFPPGVALGMPAGAALDLNLHYANRTAIPIKGEAFANLYLADPASVQHVAKTLNMANLSISLPPDRRTTLEKTFIVSQTTTVFALTSHMHMLGERFQIKIVNGARDGELVYENTDWEHPQLLLLSTPIVLQAGEGLKSVITWNNTTGHTVQFGLLSTDEMGIIFGYYY